MALKLSDLGFEIDPVAAAAYASAVLAYEPPGFGHFLLDAVDLSRGTFRVSLMPSIHGTTRWGTTTEWAPSAPKGDERLRGTPLNRSDLPVNAFIESMLNGPGDILCAIAPEVPAKPWVRTWDPPPWPLNYETPAGFENYSITRWEDLEAFDYASLLRCRAGRGSHKEIGVLSVGIGGEFLSSGRIGAEELRAIARGAKGFYLRFTSYDGHLFWVRD